MMTIQDALLKTTIFFKGKEINRPRLEAEILLAYVLDMRRLDLYMQFDKVLTENELEQYRETLRRRGAGEPVAYITGGKEFFSLELEVTPDVLIPRPETEELIETVASWIRESGKFDNGEFSFFDIGTGSGAIAVTLLHLFPNSRAFASDISSGALDVARRNAARHNVENRVTFIEGSILGNFSDEVDFIVSNPPYIRTNEKDLIAAETLKFEPAEALFAGERGTEVIEDILVNAPKILRPDNRIFLEISPFIVPDLEKILKNQKNFSHWEFIKDSAKKIRFLILDFRSTSA